TTLVRAQMEQHTSHPNRRGVCRKPCFPSLENQLKFDNREELQVTANETLCQELTTPSGVDHKLKECLRLLECMHANLQLQIQLAQQQMAIVENVQASMTQLSPGRESKNSFSSLPALSHHLLLSHLPQFSK
ncbi:hypothetical protein MC885_014575, partial [Smutsia gigantea]